MADKLGSEDKYSWSIEWKWIGYAALFFITFLFYRSFRAIYGFLIKLFHRSLACVNSKYRRRLALLHWIETRTEQELHGFADLWQNPETVTILIDSVIPRVDLEDNEVQSSRHATLQQAQQLVSRYFDVRPMFLGEELKKQWDRKIEKKFIRFLHVIKASIESLESASKQEDAGEYVARGMGLLTATRGEPSSFFIYSRHELNFEFMRIEIVGPNGDQGARTIKGSCANQEIQTGDVKITFEIIDNKGSVQDGVKKCLKVAYTPNQVGEYKLSIVKQGYIILGSPFNITVDDSRRRSLNSDPRSKAETKIINRVVDFVNEKMLLTDKGELIKIANDPDRENSVALTKLRAKMTEQSAVAISLARILQKDAKPTPEVFFDICEYIMKTCHFILQNSSCSRGLRLVSGANKFISRGNGSSSSGVLDDGIITAVAHTEQEMQKLLEGRCNRETVDDTKVDNDVAFLEQLMGEETSALRERSERRRKLSRHSPRRRKSSFLADSLEDDVFLHTATPSRLRVPERDKASIIMNRSQLNTPDIVYVNLLEAEEHVTCRKIDGLGSSAPGSLDGLFSSEHTVTRAREFFRQNRSLRDSHKIALDLETDFFKTVEESLGRSESMDTLRGADFGIVLTETSLQLEEKRFKNLKFESPNEAQRVHETIAAKTRSNISKQFNCYLNEREDNLKNQILEREGGSIECEKIELNHVKASKITLKKQEQIHQDQQTKKPLKSVKKQEAFEKSDLSDNFESLKIDQSVIVDRSEELNTVEVAKKNVSVRKIICDFEKMLRTQNEQVDIIIGSILDQPSERYLDYPKNVELDATKDTQLQNDVKFDVINDTLVTLEKAHEISNKQSTSKNKESHDTLDSPCIHFTNVSPNGNIETKECIKPKLEKQQKLISLKCIESPLTAEEDFEVTSDTQPENQSTVLLQTKTDNMETSEPLQEMTSNEEVNETLSSPAHVTGNFQTELLETVVAPFNIFQKKSEKKPDEGTVQEEILAIGKTLVEALMRNPIQTEVVEKVIRRISFHKSLSDESVQMWLNSVDENSEDLSPDAQKVFSEIKAQINNSSGEEFSGQVNGAIESSADKIVGSIISNDFDCTHLADISKEELDISPKDFKMDENPNENTLDSKSVQDIVKHAFTEETSLETLISRDINVELRADSKDDLIIPDIELSNAGVQLKKEENAVNVEVSNECAQKENKDVRATILHQTIEADKINHSGSITDSGMPSTLISEESKKLLVEFVQPATFEELQLKITEKEGILQNSSNCKESNDTVCTNSSTVPSEVSDSDFLQELLPHVEISAKEDISFHENILIESYGKCLNEIRVMKNVDVSATTNDNEIQEELNFGSSNGVVGQSPCFLSESTQSEETETLPDPNICNLSHEKCGKSSNHIIGQEQIDLVKAVEVNSAGENKDSANLPICYTAALNDSDVNITTNFTETVSVIEVRPLETESLDGVQKKEDTNLAKNLAREEINSEGECFEKVLIQEQRKLTVVDISRNGGSAQSSQSSTKNEFYKCSEPSEEVLNHSHIEQSQSQSTSGRRIADDIFCDKQATVFAEVIEAGEVSNEPHPNLQISDGEVSSIDTSIVLKKDVFEPDSDIALVDSPCSVLNQPDSKTNITVEIMTFTTSESRPSILDLVPCEVGSEDESACPSPIDKSADFSEKVSEVDDHSSNDANLIVTEVHHASANQNLKLFDHKSAKREEGPEPCPHLSLNDTNILCILDDNKKAPEPLDSKHAPITKDPIVQDVTNDETFQESSCEIPESSIITDVSFSLEESAHSKAVAKNSAINPALTIPRVSDDLVGNAEKSECNRIDSVDEQFLKIQTSTIAPPHVFDVVLRSEKPSTVETNVSTDIHEQLNHLVRDNIATFEKSCLSISSGEKAISRAYPEISEIPNQQGVIKDIIKNFENKLLLIEEQSPRKHKSEKMELLKRDEMHNFSHQNLTQDKLENAFPTQLNEIRPLPAVSPETVGSEVKLVTRNDPSQLSVSLGNSILTDFCIDSNKTIRCKLCSDQPGINQNQSEVPPNECRSRTKIRCKLCSNQSSGQDFHSESLQVNKEDKLSKETAGELLEDVEGNGIIRSTPGSVSNSTSRTLNVVEYGINSLLSSNGETKNSLENLVPKANAAVLALGTNQSTEQSTSSYDEKCVENHRVSDIDQSVQIRNESKQIFPSKKTTNFQDNETGVEIMGISGTIVGNVASTIDRMETKSEISIHKNQQGYLERKAMTPESTVVIAVNTLELSCFEKGRDEVNTFLDSNLSAETHNDIEIVKTQKLESKAFKVDDNLYEIELKSQVIHPKETKEASTMNAKDNFEQQCLQNNTFIIKEACKSKSNVSVAQCNERNEKILQPRVDIEAWSERKEDQEGNPVKDLPSDSLVSLESIDNIRDKTVVNLNEQSLGTLSESCISDEKEEVSKIDGECSEKISNSPEIKDILAVNNFADQSEAKNIVVNESNKNATVEHLNEESGPVPKDRKNLNSNIASLCSTRMVDTMSDEKQYDETIEITISKKGHGEFSINDSVLENQTKTISETKDGNLNINLSDGFNLSSENVSLSLGDNTDLSRKHIDLMFYEQDSIDVFSELTDGLIGPNINKLNSVADFTPIDENVDSCKSNVEITFFEQQSTEINPKVTESIVGSGTNKLNSKADFVSSIENVDFILYEQDSTEIKPEITERLVESNINKFSSKADLSDSDKNIDSSKSIFDFSFYEQDSTEEINRLLSEETDSSNCNIFSSSHDADLSEEKTDSSNNNLYFILYEQDSIDIIPESIENAERSILNESKSSESEEKSGENTVHVLMSEQRPSMNDLSRSAVNETDLTDKTNQTGEKLDSIEKELHLVKNELIVIEDKISLIENEQDLAKSDESTAKNEQLDVRSSSDAMEHASDVPKCESESMADDVDLKTHENEYVNVDLSFQAFEQSDSWYSEAGGETLAEFHSNSLLNNSWLDIKADDLLSWTPSDAGASASVSPVPMKVNRELDFESIISAPNLEAALKKLEQKINSANQSETDSDSQNDGVQISTLDSESFPCINADIFPEETNTDFTTSAVSSSDPLFDWRTISSMGPAEREIWGFSNVVSCPEFAEQKVLTLPARSPRISRPNTPSMDTIKEVQEDQEDSFINKTTNCNKFSKYSGDNLPIITLTPEQSIDEIVGEPTIKLFTDESLLSPLEDIRFREDLKILSVLDFMSLRVDTPVPVCYAENYEENVVTCQQVGTENLMGQEYSSEINTNLEPDVEVMLISADLLNTINSSDLGFDETIKDSTGQLEMPEICPLNSISETLENISVSVKSDETARLISKRDRDLIEEASSCENSQNGTSSKKGCDQVEDHFASRGQNENQKNMTEASGLSQAESMIKIETPGSIQHVFSIYEPIKHLGDSSRTSAAPKKCESIQKPNISLLEEIQQVAGRGIEARIKQLTKAEIDPSQPKNEEFLHQTANKDGKVKLLQSTLEAEGSYILSPSKRELHGTTSKINFIKEEKDKINEHIVAQDRETKMSGSNLVTYWKNYWDKVVEENQLKDDSCNLSNEQKDGVKRCSHNFSPSQDQMDLVTSDTGVSYDSRNRRTDGVMSENDIKRERIIDRIQLFENIVATMELEKSKMFLRMEEKLEAKSSTSLFVRDADRESESEDAKVTVEDDGDKPGADLEYRKSKCFRNKFTKLKEYFELLEKHPSKKEQNETTRQDIGNENACSSCQLQNKFDIDINKRKRRKRKSSSRRKLERGIIQSAPTSDSETPPAQHAGHQLWGSERLGRQVAERIHIKDLFEDVFNENDRTGLFRGGVPNRKAVLASLRSIELNVDQDCEKWDNARSTGQKDLEFIDRLNMSNVPRSYQNVYPWIPTTPISQYRSRPCAEHNLIPRNALLQILDDD